MSKQKTTIEMNGKTYQVLSQWDLKRNQIVVHHDGRLLVLREDSKTGLAKPGTSEHNSGTN